MLKREDKKPYLSFLINNKKYIIHSKDVKEIIKDYEIYPLPFVPKYVKGILDYFGKPYTIIDLSLFYKNSECSTKCFIITNDNNDIALQIDSPIEFTEENAKFKLIDLNKINSKLESEIKER